MEANENADGAPVAATTTPTLLSHLLLPRTGQHLVVTTSILAAVVVVLLMVGLQQQRRRQRKPKPPHHPCVAIFKVVFSCIRWFCSNLRLRWKLVQFHLKAASSSSADEKEDNATETSMIVSGLFIHPVKSLRAIAVPASTLDCQGLTHDRRCMVVYAVPVSSSSSRRSSYRFLTQRQCPSLATIAATIRLRRSSSTKNGEQEELVLEHTTVVSTKTEKKSTKETTIQGKTNKTPNNINNNTHTICIPLDQKAACEPITYYAGIWDDTVLVRDLGDAAAHFFQRIVDHDEEMILASSSALSGEDGTASIGNNHRRVRLVTLATAAGSSASYEFDDRSYIPGYAKTWTGGYLGKPTLTDGVRAFFFLLTCNDFLHGCCCYRGSPHCY